MNVRSEVSAVDAQPRQSSVRRVATNILGESGARRVARVKTLGDAFAHSHLTRVGREAKTKLDALRGRHSGEKCVIIGNGPSLRNTPMDLLANVPTFGLNRIYLMRDQLGFEPTYHVVVNRLVVEQCAEDFNRIETPLFTTFSNSDVIRSRSNTHFLNRIVGPHFSRNCSYGIWEGATVTYVAMQLAYHMGFSKVALVGVDHRFSVSGPAHQVVESNGADNSHFDPNYFGKGFRWQLPDLDTSEVGYAYARRAYESAGRQIVDATVGGALQIFPKASLEDFLSS